MQLSIQKPYREELEVLRRGGELEVALANAPVGGLHGPVASYFVRRIEHDARRTPDVYDRTAGQERWRVAGWPVAELAASGVDGRGIPFRVHATPPGRLLDEVLDGSAPGERRRLTRDLGRLLCGLHDAGERHGALHAWNVVVTEAGDLRLLAVAATARAPGWAPLDMRDRAHDLATLFATLTLEQLSSAGRWRLLGHCVAEPAQRHSLWRLVHRERQRWHGQGCFPRGPWVERRPVAAAADRRAGDAPTGLFLHEALATTAVCSTAVSDWANPPGARCVRERDGRRNLVWERPDGERWYGKSHLSPDRRPRPAALREFDAHRSLSWLGLPVPVVRVAAADATGRSVLWTLGVVPGTTLRDHLHTGRTDAETRLDLEEVARCVRRLHRAGFCHRDLYLDHFLLEQREDTRRWVLMDLMRLEEHAALPRRARLRDLARLEYSARTCGVSRAQRLRAFRIYLGGPRRVDRLMWRSVLARADRIERRERRHGRFPVPAP